MGLLKAFAMGLETDQVASPLDQCPSLSGNIVMETINNQETQGVKIYFQATIVEPHYYVQEYTT